MEGGNSVVYDLGNVLSLASSFVSLTLSVKSTLNFPCQIYR